MHMKTITTFAAILVLTGCVQNQWEAKEKHDEFTGTEACVVEVASPGINSYISLWFFAEKREGEVRAGVRNIPAVPIAGDVQLKVGDKLYTLTSQDVPLDIMPTMPDLTQVAGQAGGKNYTKALNEMTQNIQKMGSPYRAYVGSKAVTLLRDMVHTGAPVKLRTVGINSQLSTTGEFVTGPAFTAALQKCGIGL